jgi:hypothetical protein
VAKVNYLIDGDLIWTEHHAPYYYGGDDGKNVTALVTTFLRPGLHTFTFAAVSIGGQTATDTVKARVVQAPPLPAQLVGTWTHSMGRKPCGDCKNGSETISITKLGWGFEPQPPWGDRWDARYLADGKVVFGPEVITSRKSYHGAFCGVDPLFTWTYTVSTDGQSFQLQPNGADPCPDRLHGLQGTWTRTG